LKGKVVMTKILAGKVALVTGGSRGIGAAIARQLAEQGANVAFSYVSSAVKADTLVGELESAGVKAASFKADQSNSAEVTKLVGDVVAKFGRLDILVNNAGVFETGALHLTEDTSGFERQYAINIQGVVAAIRAAGRVMGDGGRIISISSVAATLAGAPGLADYVATKAAVEGYTKGAARDLAAKGITVNAVGVGAVNTDMNPEDGPISDWLKGGTALGRYGRPEEIAAVVGFLASPAASFVTGSIVIADGGFSA
jgi:3-oxoacyl-[acyl-carrier protein] reductase